MPPPARLPVAPLPHGLQKKAGKLDIHAMFELFNAQYFANSLNGVYVEYSKKMTRCAGTCTFFGPRGGCRIGLSEPLLSLRSPEDTVSTLLHEAIHASLFLKFGVERDSSDGHGPRFLAEAERISKLSGVAITVFHNFTDEVEAHLRHWWTCSSCGRVIKRAMNRAPAPADLWWPEHARACNGHFEKTHEPPPPSKRPRHGAVAVAAAGLDAASALGESIVASRTLESSSKKPMRVHRIDEMFQSRDCEVARMKTNGFHTVNMPPSKAKSALSSIGHLSCPACNQGGFLNEAAVDSHLDSCLAGVFLSQAEPVPVSPRKSEKKKLAKPLSVEKENVIVLSDDDVAMDVDLAAPPPDSVPPRSKDNPAEPCVVPASDVESVDDLNNPSNVGGLGSFERPQNAPHNDACVVGKSDSLGFDTECTVTKKTQASSGLSAGKPHTHMMRTMESSKMLDFALGLSEPDDDLDIVALLESGPPSKSSRASCFNKVPKLPRIVFNDEKPDHEDLVDELTERIGLWQPNSDPLEAPFAGSAARHGLTPSEFMQKLLRDSTPGADGMVLSEQARQMFLKSDRAAKVLGKRAVQNSVPDARGLDDSVTNRPRPYEKVGRKDPVPESVSRLDTRSNPSHSEPPARLKVRSTSNARSRGRSSTGVKMSSGRRIDSFFKPKPPAVQAPKETARTNQSASRAVPAALPITGPDLSLSGTCPVCDAIVPKNELSCHIDACMMALDAPPLPLEPTIERRHRGDRAESSDTDLVDCPICSKRVPRRELEQHTQTCIASSGLDFAFG